MLIPVALSLLGLAHDDWTGRLSTGFGPCGSSSHPVPNSRYRGAGFRAALGRDFRIRENGEFSGFFRNRQCKDHCEST